MSPHLAALSHEEPPRLLSNVLLKPIVPVDPVTPLHFAAQSWLTPY